MENKDIKNIYEESDIEEHAKKYIKNFSSVYFKEGYSEEQIIKLMVDFTKDILVFNRCIDMDIPL